MKKVTLTTSNNSAVQPKAVLTAVLSQSPNKPISVEEMRKRVRVMEAIEQSGEGESFHLEDSDHQVLMESLENFPWSQANRALLNLIDDVRKAENVSFLKVVERQAKEEPSQEQGVPYAGEKES
jgi:hypothetical protein